jgi:hypothetical protein
MSNLHFAKDNTSELLVAGTLPQQGPPPGGEAQAGRPQMGAGPAAGQPQQMGGGPMGQQQQGHTQTSQALAQNLSKYVLPSRAVADSDMPGIKIMINAVCGEISTSIKSAGQKVDNEAIKTGILGFQNWLKKQGCITEVTSPYNIESADKYAAEIFASFPGTLPFHFEFKLTGNVTKPYRLLLFISKVDLFSLASLVENKTINGVPVPKDWPENPWSYWNNRL